MFCIPRTGKLDPESKGGKNQRAADLAGRRGGYEAAPRGAGGGGGGAEAAGRHGELLVERHLIPGRRSRAAAPAGVADVEAREQWAHHLPLLLPASPWSCTSPRHPPRGQEPERARTNQSGSQLGANEEGGERAQTERCGLVGLGVVFILGQGRAFCDGVSGCQKEEKGSGGGRERDNHP